MNFFRKKNKISGKTLSIEEHVQKLRKNSFTVINPDPRNIQALFERIVSEYENKYPNDEVKFTKETFMCTQIYKTSLKK